ncbi:unnamed protein product, partial [Adineta steineri]
PASFAQARIWLDGRI